MSRHPTTAAERLAAQPRRTTYLVVALILMVLTGMEVTVYNLTALRPVLVPVLLVLMVAKAALIAMFYMHLRFDDRMLTWVFLMLMFFAVSVVFSLVFLFFYFHMEHPGA